MIHNNEDLKQEYDNQESDFVDECMDPCMNPCMDPCCCDCGCDCCDCIPEMPEPEIPKLDISGSIAIKVLKPERHIVKIVEVDPMKSNSTNSTDQNLGFPLETQIYPEGKPLKGIPPIFLKGQ